MTNLRFEHIRILESNEPLVSLSKAGLFVEPAYYNLGHSPTREVFARSGVVDRLLEIERASGLRFKIWDAWRPREVQRSIYVAFREELRSQHPTWDERKLDHETGIYVTAADAEDRIPPHSTGGAVDLTLVDAALNELEMGTAFDHFGPEAATMFFEEESSNHPARENRRLLRTLMTEEGFALDQDEWWHFDFGTQKWAVELSKDFAIYGEAVLSA